MQEVLTTTNGSWTLAETQDTFQAFEASGARFLKIELSALGGTPKNVAHYEDLPAGQQPATKIRLQLASEAMPAQASEVWKGQMYVAGASVEVRAYRPK